MDSAKVVFGSIEDAALANLAVSFCGYWTRRGSSWSNLKAASCNRVGVV